MVNNEELKQAFNDVMDKLLLEFAKRRKA